MNRQTKRMMQRQGQGQPGSDGEPSQSRTSTDTLPRREVVVPPVKEHQTVPERTGEYLREVRGELVKVAWPSRPEVVNYTIVVFVALVLLTSFIFGLNYLAGHLVFILFPTRP